MTNYEFAKKVLNKNNPNTINSITTKVGDKIKRSLQRFVNYITTLYLTIYEII